MRIRVVPSSVSQEACQFAASYVIDDILAVDAGSIGFSSIAEQKRIRHLFLSHAHLDHVASLPIFIDNVYTPGPDCPIVYASQQVIDTLRTCLFNDQVWPDVLRLSRNESPFVRLVAIKAHQPVSVGGMRITPIPLNHVVPCFGFIVEESDTAVAFVSDTGPTEEIWSVARQLPNLKAVFLEAAFPDAYEWLAQRTSHLTPGLFIHEYRKLRKDVPVIAIHIKCGFYDQVVAELRQLPIPDLRISSPNSTYEF